jgi:hypothetical protein
VATADESLAARIAVLERVTQEILIERFMGMGDPVAAFRDYSDTRRTPPPSAGPAGAAAIESAWKAYLDLVFAGLQSEIAERE